MIGCRNPMGNFLQLFIDKRKRRLLCHMRSRREPDPTTSNEVNRWYAKLLQEPPGRLSGGRGPS
jgi:hypothetical protein